MHRNELGFEGGKVMAFHGKVAVITGGASGMGRLSALRLAAQAKVAILDLNESALKEVAASHPNLHAYRCDISDIEQVRATFQKIEQELGPIDRVTHCAAIMPSSPLANQSPEAICRVMRINYEGTVNVVGTIFSKMAERKSGDIIVYGSLAGHVLAPHLGAYCATKSAVNTYTEVMINENRGSGVRILLCCPPAVDTPLLQQATSKPKHLELAKERKLLATPEQIVDEIEVAIEQGKEIIFPTFWNGKFLLFLRRLSPKLLWSIIQSTMK